MKAPTFRYVRPRSLSEALDILAEEEGAVPVAGGQSLLAGLNMRLSAPELLVDIENLDELRVLESRQDGIVLGALTRHREVLQSELLAEKLPLLPRAASHVAHVGIRNRGTLGGSLAYADPAAELPACCVALNATIVIASRAGTREIAAADFFKSLLETDLKRGELIVAVRFPVPQARMQTAFAELARRHGDFAIAGVVVVATEVSRRIDGARVVFFGCVDRAKIARNTTGSLLGSGLPIVFSKAIEEAVADDLEPDDTPGCRADTKLHLAQVLMRRALGQLSEGFS